MFGLMTQLRLKFRLLVKILAVLAAVTLSKNGTAVAAEDSSGCLFIIGGGLRPDNSQLFKRLIREAGGEERSRFVIFSTASKSLTSSKKFVEVLKSYGVPAERIEIIDLLPENAAQLLQEGKILDQIRQSTAAYFVGGDQQRIVQTLLTVEGTETTVLQELRKLKKRGGVIAGTSAGAAMQSAVMITAGGLPDETLDAGLDSLDFGIVSKPYRRGLYISKGLGFFQGGIVDQHFSQYRGRLGRLAYANISQKVRYGFGIDENTAMFVNARDEIEVLGTGCLTIVDASQAEGVNKPLGYEAHGIRVSCLRNGDRFNPSNGMLTVHADKKRIIVGSEENRGNFLLGDMGAEGAVPFALFSGLADNSSRKQIGVALGYTQDFGHGYRFVFRKDQKSVGWAGYVDNLHSYAVQNIDLTIEPVLTTLGTPRTNLPTDLPEGVTGIACQSLWFRGVLLADENRRFRPEAPISRMELAIALTRIAHLLPPAGDVSWPSDVSVEDAIANEVAQVLAAKILECDGDNRFRPNDKVSRQEAARIFVRLCKLTENRQLPETKLQIKDVNEILPAMLSEVRAAIEERLLTLDGGRFHPTRSCTRQEAAETIYRILGLPW